MNEIKELIQGSIVAIVTPMTGTGTLDIPSLNKLLEFHIEQGTDAVVAVGTTGESATLDEDEHCQVIRRVVEQVSGRIPVIAGTGANSTREALNLTQRAKTAGADACLLVTPYYNKPTQEGLYLHHKAIAETVDIPQILYNVPGRTACDMLPETVHRLSLLDNIIGVKEATGDLQRLVDIQTVCSDSFKIFSGDDASTRAFLLQGGHGCISVTANVAPKLMHDMCAAALAGDATQAEQLDNQLVALHRDLFIESNPIPVKWALKELGFMEEGIRLPLTWLAQPYHDTLRQALQQANLI